MFVDECSLVTPTCVGSTIAFGEIGILEFGIRFRFWRKKKSRYQAGLTLVDMALLTDGGWSAAVTIPIRLFMHASGASSSISVAARLQSGSGSLLS